MPETLAKDVGPWVKTTCPVQDKQMKSRVILSAHLPRQRRVQRFKVGSVDGFNSSAPTSLLSLTIFCIVIGEMPTISPNHVWPESPTLDIRGGQAEKMY